MMRKLSLSNKRAGSFSCFGVVWMCLLVSLEVLMSQYAVADNKGKVDTPWKKYKDFNGIIGYERIEKGAKYLETRAETVIDAPIEVLLEVLNDISSYPKWMYKCTEAILLKKEGAYKRVLYFSQGVPMGSPDRDAIIEAMTVEDWNKGNCVITLHSIGNYPYTYPTKEHHKKHLRMIEFRGMWDLQMIDRDRTKVIYTAYTYPGGIAPKFIVDGVIRKVSFRSLESMIPLIKKQKYIKAAEKSDAKKQIDAAIKNGHLVFIPMFHKKDGDFF